MIAPHTFGNEQPSNYDLAIGFLQVFDLLLNVSQSSNDDIMKELQHQNSDYLETLNDKLSKIQQQNVALILNTDKILDNQKEILSILKKTTD